MAGRSYEIVTDSNVRIVPRKRQRCSGGVIQLDNPDDPWDAAGEAARRGAPPPAPTGKDMTISNLPTPFSFALDWADIPPASQFAIIGLMTAVSPPNGAKDYGFSISDLARDVGAIVGDVFKCH